MKSNKKCICVILKDRDDPDLGFKINITIVVAALLHLDPNSPEAQAFNEKGVNSNGDTDNPSPSPSGTKGSSENGRNQGTDEMVTAKNGATAILSLMHKIILGIAESLAYLREESHARIIHRDIKLSSILLLHTKDPVRSVLVSQRRQVFVLVEEQILRLQITVGDMMTVAEVDDADHLLNWSDEMDLQFFRIRDVGFMEIRKSHVSNSLMEKKIYDDEFDCCAKMTVVLRCDGVLMMFWMVLDGNGR
ncbi:hypothetical protein V8G54_027395 [Vigna mungo]|uniref:Protein kinase domain-containing protein n=1 Tax=Vigna mungo TaxID=3915 RepID=A0AAQ3N2R5_VIGMU